MALTAEPVRDGGFGLYLHWPFCQAKCPYCDFNSHVAAAVDQRRWAEAIRREIGRVATMTGPRRLDSVFFGGGTPSLMAAETVAAVMDAVRAAWTMDDGCEVTLEANPTSVEAERFAGYRSAGVNRVSLGVQALDDDDLRRLGRRHDVAEARAAFHVARAAFDRVSFDLIYARQDQRPDRWRDELHRALDLAIDHLSLYQLTIEPGTAFADRLAHGGLVGLPDEDLAADLYEMTLEICGEAGFDAYEVSNFARSGAECRHNLLYWSAGDYAGIGPGAHGRLTLDGIRHATEAIRAPALWLAAAEAGDSSTETLQPLEPVDQVNEYLMMGLRTRQGLSRRRLEELAPPPELWQAIRHMEAEGLMELTADRVIARPGGRMVLDSLLRELML